MILRTSEILSDSSSQLLTSAQTERTETEAASEKRTTTTNDFSPTDRTAVLLKQLDGWQQSTTGRPHWLATHKPLTILGVLQLNGLGQGSTDPAAGLELLQKASVLGVPQVITLLKSLVKMCRGLITGVVDKLRYDPDASFYLGLCCERGLAVPKDRVAAAEHYSKAASQNHAQASDALAAIQKATQPRVQAELADRAKPAQKLSTGDRAHAVHLSRYLGVVLPQLIAGNKELRAVDGLVSSDDYSSTCAPCNDTSPTDTSLGVYVL
ncbi:hypothetical protein HPB48_014823 [Haemaphysalis longicornis]|uniref:Uncharacterized protein n=1 Tax=Haemaphysalis longicornis TaxID=44386 RepID=A0A9J6GGU8_HAELO|nr:hypothetical protein HPB48_014823 [Haemaphysalis longicornis]